MTLLAKRLSTAALVALVAIVIALPMSASAAGGPFVEKRITLVPQPDAIPLLGSATALADADTVTGLVSADASVTERAPIGFTGSSLGTSQSTASGQLVQLLDIPDPGRYKVGVTIAIDQPVSATKTSLAIPGFADASSSLTGVAGMAFVLCDEAGVCSPGPGGSTGSAYQAIACSNGCQVPPLVTLESLIDAPQPGKIYVLTGLTAYSAAQGLGSARAFGGGHVVDVSATPVGAAPPPPPPQPGNTRVLVDTVTVDSRGGAEASHLPLDAGKFYLLEPAGAYSYTAGGTADAECADMPGDSAYKPNRFPADVDGDGDLDDQLDLRVDGSDVTWTPASGSANATEAACSDTHTYEMVVTGAGNTVSFDLNDPSKADDLGAMTVKIYLLP